MDVFQSYLLSLAKAAAAEDGEELAKHFAFSDPHRKQIASSIRKINDLKSYIANRIPEPWSDLCYQHCLIISQRPTQDHSSISNLQVTLAQMLYSILPNLTRWILPLVYVINKDLQVLAGNADIKMTKLGEKADNVENAARTMNKAFSLCAVDRLSSIHDSRKWGVYNIVNLLFKTYFQLGSINLCTNILKSLNNADLPSFNMYPKSQQVTFKYYCGVLSFYNEQFEQARQELEFSFSKSLKDNEQSFVNQTYSNS